MSAPAKPMGANSPTSRAGTPSRKPTGSSALMAGAGRRLTPAASSPAKIAAPSLRSISPGCGFRCRPTAQPSFEKVMARVKAMAPRPVRCTTSRSKLPKPMPPSVLWQPSANRSGLRFMGLASHHQSSQRCHSSLVCQAYTAIWISSR